MNKQEMKQYSNLHILGIQHIKVVLSNGKAVSFFYNYQEGDYDLIKYIQVTGITPSQLGFQIWKSHTDSPWGGDSLDMGHIHDWCMFEGTFLIEAEKFNVFNLELTGFTINFYLEAGSGGSHSAAYVVVYYSDNDEDCDAYETDRVWAKQSANAELKIVYRENQVPKRIKIDINGKDGQGGHGMGAITSLVYNKAE